jgi:O-antigen/teichoic acid export membrane protein
LSGGLVVFVALNLVLARQLGAPDFGAYAFAIACVEVLALLSPLGFDRLVTREASIEARRNQLTGVHGLLSAATRVTLAGSVCGAVLAAAIVALLRSRLDPVLFPAFWIALCIVPVRALTHLRSGLLVGLDRPVLGTAATTAVYPALLLLAVAIAGVFDQIRLTAATTMTIALSAAAVTLVWVAYVSRTRLIVPPASAARARTWRRWLSAAFSMVSITALGVVNVRADVILVGTMINASSAGIYFVASQLAFGLRFGMMAATPALLSVAAPLHSDGAKSQLQAAVSSAARLVVAIAAAAYLLLMVAGRQVLGLFGEEFVAGHRVMVVLATGTLLMMALGPNEPVLMMTGNEKRAALAGGASTVVNIGLNIVLIPRFGIEGAAAATAISGLAWAVILNRQVVRWLGIQSAALRSREST